MKILFVLATAAAFVGATEETESSGIAYTEEQVVDNELLQNNRRIFRGGWGNEGASAGPPASSPFRVIPAPQLDNGLMNLFNAMSNFGLSPSYGPPGTGGAPSSQYGPPSGIKSSAASVKVLSSSYGAPGSAGSGGGSPTSEYGPPGVKAGKPLGGYSDAGLAGPPTPVKTRGPAANPGFRTPGVPGGISQDGGRIFRYVSLFTAPDEPPPPKRKVVRAGPTTPDKHVQIIFVRPPTPPAEQQTEVILSPQPERKTIVYVLMKRPEQGQDTVRVRPAPPTSPSKPEVFFIPYQSPSNKPEGNNPNAGGYENNGPDNSGGSSGGYSEGQVPSNPSGGYEGPPPPPSSGGEYSTTLSGAYGSAPVNFGNGLLIS